MTNPNRCCDKCRRTEQIQLTNDNSTGLGVGGAMMTRCINPNCTCHHDQCKWEPPHKYEDCPEVDFAKRQGAPASQTTPTTYIGWEEELQFGIMEDYLMTASLEHISKNTAVHKEEMRRHWDKLKSFIQSLLKKVKKEENSAVIYLVQTAQEQGEKSGYTEGRAQAIQQIKSDIEKMKKNIGEKPTSSDEIPVWLLDFGWNAALKAAQKLITERMKQ